VYSNVVIMYHLTYRCVSGAVCNMNVDMYLDCGSIFRSGWCLVGFVKAGVPFGVTDIRCWLFGPLKKAYSKKIEEFMRMHITYISKLD